LPGSHGHAGSRRLKGLRDEIKLFRLARSAEPQEV
jgi:hypothetical protein